MLDTIYWKQNKNHSNLQLVEVELSHTPRKTRKSFLVWRREEDLPELQLKNCSSGLDNLVLSTLSSNWFSAECEHPFIDKQIVITEPTVPSGWLLGLGSSLNPSNKKHILVDLCNREIKHHVYVKRQTT